MLKKFLGVLFLFCFFITSVYSQGYYADINIDIKSDGAVSIDGITNYAPFQNVTNSYVYTSKKSEFWTFNISSDVVFDDYIFELKLPESAQINYVKTTPNFRIENKDNRLVLIGLDENKPLNIIVQYKKDGSSTDTSDNYLIVFLGVFVVFVLFALLFYSIKLVKKSKKKVIVAKVENSENKKEVFYNFDILPNRQKEIIRLLEKNEKLSQKELEGLLKIPKSSVSRNVNSLVSKGILYKERVGQTSYVFLQKND